MSNCNVCTFKRQHDKINDCPSNTCTFCRRNYAILFLRSLSGNYLFIIASMSSVYTAERSSQLKLLAFVTELDLKIPRQKRDVFTMETL